MSEETVTQEVSKDVKPDSVFPDIVLHRERISGPAKLALTCLFLLFFIIGLATGMMYMEHRFFEITGHGSPWVMKKKEVCERHIPRNEECVLTVDFKPANIEDISN